MAAGGRGEPPQPVAARSRAGGDFTPAASRATARSAPRRPPLHCPFCGHDDTQVKDSRPSDDGASIRRRRFCSHCGQRFTTIERVQLRDLTVAKTDGRRVPFDRDKLSRSIRIALRKRPVQEERIERIVNGIVRQLEAGGETEITSRQIGEQVMDTLREVDPVAYVRFASVYRDFRETKDFADFLGSLGDAK